MCCCVANQDCTAPANLTPRRTPRATCFGCGLPVCLKCSGRIKWYTWGVRRICDTCREDRDKMRELHRRAA